MLIIQKSGSFQRRNERGVFVVLTALMLLLLLGVVGLAIDVGRQMVVNVELQNSADACALAGASELNLASDAPKRAAQAGRFIGGKKNFHGFQRDNISYADPDVTFSVKREGPYVSAGSASSGSVFIKCVAHHYGLVNMFMGALGFTRNDISATAIATLQPAQLACMVPMSIHAKNPNDSTLFGFNKFDILNNQNKTLDGTTNGTIDPAVAGTFSFANPLGTVNANASDVGGWIKAFGVCNVPTKNGTCIDEVPTNGVTTEWNSRFGVYGAALNPQNAAPDLTGAAYNYQTVKGNNAAIVAYKDTDAPQKKPFNPSPGDGWAGGGYTYPQANYDAYGSTNRRLVGLPVTDESKKCGSGNGHPVVGWACGLMLAPYDTSTNKQKYRVQRIQILGRADTSPYCGTMGVPGGNNATGPLVPALVQ